MTESYRNPAQQLCVNAAFTQNLVDVGAVTANFLREPCRRAALPAQFIADKRTDVNLNATIFGSCQFRFRVHS